VASRTDERRHALQDGDRPPGVVPYLREGVRIAHGAVGLARFLEEMVDDGTELLGRDVPGVSAQVKHAALGREVLELAEELRAAIVPADFPARRGMGAVDARLEVVRELAELVQGGSGERRNHIGHRNLDLLPRQERARPLEAVHDRAPLVPGALQRVRTVEPLAELSRTSGEGGHRGGDVEGNRLVRIDPVVERGRRMREGTDREQEARLGWRPVPRVVDRSLEGALGRRVDVMGERAQRLVARSGQRASRSAVEDVVLGSPAMGTLISRLIQARGANMF